MQYLTLNQVLELHERVLAQSGGEAGIRDIGSLESALAQPRMTFSGQELYSTIEEKAAAIGFSIIQNHPFIDGNKRTGHAVMEIFLVLNGFEIDASVDDQEDIVLRVASGRLNRNEFTSWLRSTTIERKK